MKRIRFWGLGLIFFFGATSVYGTYYLAEPEEKKQKRRKLSPSSLDTVQI